MSLPRRKPWEAAHDWELTFQGDNSNNDTTTTISLVTDTHCMKAKVRSRYNKSKRHFKGPGSWPTPSSGPSTKKPVMVSCLNRQPESGHVHQKLVQQPSKSQTILWASNPKNDKQSEIIQFPVWNLRGSGSWSSKLSCCPLLVKSWIMT